MAIVMDDKTKRIGKHVGIGLGGGSLLAILLSIEPAKLMDVLSQTLAHEYMRMVALFAVAAFFHRRGMKKDNANLTAAINNLGDALREDMKLLGTKVGALEEKQDQMNSRIESLEKLKE